MFRQNKNCNNFAHLKTRYLVIDVKRRIWFICAINWPILTVEIITLYRKVRGKKSHVKTEFKSVDFKFLISFTFLRAISLINFYFQSIFWKVKLNEKLRIKTVEVIF